MCQLGRGCGGCLGPQKLWGKWCKILHSRHFQALKITLRKHDFLSNNNFVEQLLSHSAVRISSVATSILLHRYLNNRSKHFLIDIPNRLYFADSILTLSQCNFFVKCCSQDALVVGNVLGIVKYETEHGHELYRKSGS